MSVKDELRYMEQAQGLAAQLSTQLGRIEAALALHPNVDGDCFECDDGRGGSVPWPCRTVRALKGES